MIGRVFVAAVVLSVLRVAGGEAAVVCQTKTGVVVIRTECKKKETLVNLAAVGLKGDKGDKGALGAAGTPGVPGISEYEIVVAGPVGSGAELRATCPVGKTVLSGGCHNNFTSSVFWRSTPSIDGREWICGFNSGGSISIEAYAVCATVPDNLT